MKKVKIFSVTLLILIAFVSISFKPADSNSWTKFETFKGVDIFQKKVVCEVNNYKKEYIIFKYVNTTNKEIKLNWRLHIYYNDVCRSCDLKSPSEYDLQIKLSANQIKEGDCQDNNLVFKVFSSDLMSNSKSKLTKLEYSELK